MEGTNVLLITFISLYNSSNNSRRFYNMTNIDLSKIDMKEVQELLQVLTTYVAKNPDFLTDLKKNPVATIQDFLKHQKLSETTKAAVTKAAAEDKDGSLDGLFAGISQSLLGKDGKLDLGDVMRMANSVKKADKEKDGIDLGDVLEVVKDLKVDSTNTASANTKKDDGLDLGDVLNVVGKLMK